METLGKKIAEVIANVSHPPQSGTHDYMGYDYSTRDDIFGVIREELASRGVVALPSVELLNLDECGKTSKGRVQYRALVNVTVQLVCGETGESTTQKWCGEAITTEDKGIPAAATQAIRFWAVNTFMLLDGSDEQIYGNPGTQKGRSQTSNHNINRRQSPPSEEDDRARIANRLRQLDFNDKQIASFGNYIASVEEVGNFDDVPATRVRVWADQVCSTGDDEVRNRILNALQQDQAA